MLIFFVIVFFLATCSILYLLFSLESINKLFIVIKYIYETRKIKRKQTKIKMESSEIANKNRLIA